MNKRSGMRKAIVGAIVAGALTLTSLPGSVVHADGGRRAASLASDDGTKTACCAGTVDAADYVIWRDATRTQVGVGEVQEVTISKSMDHASGDTDGRDFLAWQKRW